MKNKMEQLEKKTETNWNVRSIRNIGFKTIETLGIFASAYVVVDDISQLKEISSGGIYCTIQDPRLLMSLGTAIFAKIGEIWYNKKEKKSYNK